MSKRTRFDAPAFAAELVRLPSSDPPGGELDVARKVSAELTALGIENRLDEFLPGRANVIGRVRGTGRRKPMVFSAHMDTVPIGDRQWSFDPFAGDVRGGRIRGRGSSDMKSAIAAYIGAADILKQRKTPLESDVILAFTAGESADCLGARHLLKQGFRNEIGAFLCGEPSSLDLIVVEKATLWLAAEAEGILGHVSGEAGVNAIDLMADFLAALRRLDLALPQHPLLTQPSIRVGTISGGTAVNVTPDRCIAEIDVRFGPGIDHDTVIEKIRQVAPAGVTLSLLDFKPAVEEPPDSEFSRCCTAAIREVVGSEPEILGVSYYSDAAILLDGIDAPFAIVGPGELGMSGQYDETCSVERIEAAVEIYARIAEQWGA